MRTKIINILNCLLFVAAISCESQVPKKADDDTKQHPEGFIAGADSIDKNYRKKCYDYSMKNICNAIDIPCLELDTFNFKEDSLSILNIFHFGYKENHYKIFSHKNGDTIFYQVIKYEFYRNVSGAINPPKQNIGVFSWPSPENTQDKEYLILHENRKGYYKMRPTELFFPFDKFLDDRNYKVQQEFKAEQFWELISYTRKSGKKAFASSIDDNEHIDFLQNVEDLIKKVGISDRKYELRK